MHYYMFTEFIVWLFLTFNKKLIYISVMSAWTDWALSNVYKFSCLTGRGSGWNNDFVHFIYVIVDLENERESNILHIH